MTENQQQTREQTPDEQFRMLFDRTAKLNDAVSALLNPNWGANAGILPEDHPLYPDVLEPLPGSIVKPAATPTSPQDSPPAPHNGPQRPDTGAETPDGAGGRQTGADGRETLREQYTAAIGAIWDGWIADWASTDVPDPEGILADAVLAVRDAELEQQAAAAIRDQAALAQVRLHIAAHRPRLQLADPILLGRLEAVLRQVGELEAAGGGEQE
ncbi:hypothetical protein ABT150_23230 [Streptomyces mirabilis]|uniref:hypothetical protein n=1 Tax=Streptomyces mirabilis TaxID=68239 RepID=UPI003329069D